MNQAMRKVDPFGPRQELDKVSLDLLWIRVFRQPQQSRDPFDVCVDDDSGRHTECRPQEYVRRLAANSGERHQVVQVARQLAVEAGDQLLSHATQIGRLRTKEA